MIKHHRETSVSMFGVDVAVEITYQLDLPSVNRDQLKQALREHG